MRCRLASSWNWFLTTGCCWKKPVLELDGSMVFVKQPEFKKG
jgi:hypothetical protein